MPMKILKPETAKAWRMEFAEFLGVHGYIIQYRDLLTNNIPDVIGGIAKGRYIVLNKKLAEQDPLYAFFALVHIIGHAAQIHQGDVGPLTLANDLFEGTEDSGQATRDETVEENMVLDNRATAMGLSILKRFCKEKEYSDELWGDMHRCVSLYHALDSRMFGNFLINGINPPKYDSAVPLMSAPLALVPVNDFDPAPFDLGGKALVLHASPKNYPNSNGIAFNPGNGDSERVYQAANQIVNHIHSLSPG